jgi:hypothetical protein
LVRFCDDNKTKSVFCFKLHFFVVELSYIASWTSVISGGWIGSCTDFRGAGAGFGCESARGWSG